MAGQRAESLGGWGTVKDRLGLRRNVVVMLAAILAVGLGEELWVRFLPEYLTALGAGAWAVAAYGTLKDFLDAVYQYPGGWLADRLGRRAALVAFTLAATAGYLTYLFAPSWGWVLAGTVLVMAWDSLTLPALFAGVADNLPKDRRGAGFGMQSILRRVPAIVAPPLGGLLIGWLGVASGVRAGLAVTVALCLAAVAVTWRFHADDRPARHEPISLAQMWRRMDGRLKRLLASDVLARWAEGVPRVFVVIYALGPLGLSPLEFGWLMTIQRLTNVALYVPAAALSDRMNRKPFVLATFAFFALFPLALALAGGFWGAALAFVVAGLWEVGEPARKALIVDLADESARGRAVGVYYLARNLSVFPAALVGGLLWQTAGPKGMLYAAFGAGAAGFLLYLVWGSGDDPRSAEAATAGP